MNDFLKDFSENTRIWIYQSPRDLTAAEQEWIEHEKHEFINSWNAHGRKIKSAVEILHSRFILIAADQDFTPSSGCSIDASVSFIRKIEARLGMDLMDRMLVNYLDEGSLKSTRLSDLPHLYATKAITDDSVVFNTLVDNKAAFNREWQAPLKTSWHFRFVQ